MQEVLRTQQQEPVPVLTAALNMLNAARPKGNPADVHIWPQWDLLRPHVAFAVTAAEQRGIDHPTSDLMVALGSLLSGKALYAEAERLKRSALAIDERAHGPVSTQVALRLNNLAETLRVTNRPREAEPMYRRALAIDEQCYGAEHSNVARDLNNVALLLQATDRLAEAEPLMRRALVIFRTSLGDEHPSTLTVQRNLDLLLAAMK